MSNHRKGSRAQSQMKQKTRLDSTSEITSQYDAVQLNLEGRCRTDGSIWRAAILNVCNTIVEFSEEKTT